MTNEERAAIADEALNALPEREDDTWTDIIDLTTNLLHLAHQEGLDPQTILRMAETHLEEEER